MNLLSARRILLRSRLTLGQSWVRMARTSSIEAVRDTSTRKAWAVWESATQALLTSRLVEHERIEIEAGLALLLDLLRSTAKDEIPGPEPQAGEQSPDYLLRCLQRARVASATVRGSFDGVAVAIAPTMTLDDIVMAWAIAKRRRRRAQSIA